VAGRIDIDALRNHGKRVATSLATLRSPSPKAAKVPQAADIPTTTTVPATAATTRKRARPRQDGDLLDEHQVAGMLAVSVSTIRRWRLLQRGPKFVKVGFSVRYKPETVRKWMDSRESGGER